MVDSRIVPALHMPEPLGEEETVKTEGIKDTMEQLEKEMARAVRVRTYQSLAEGTRPQETSERIGIDVGAVVKAQGDTVNTLIEKLTDMMTKNETAAQDTELRQLREELKALRTSLTSGGDPLAALMQSMEVQDRLADRMKERLGIPNMALAGGSGTNLPALMQLEQMKIDAAERDRQWQEQMEERRQEWKRADERWAADFGLKREESHASRQVQERAGGALEDLAGAVIESIDHERGVAGSPEEPVTYRPQKRVRKPPSFRCECGATVALAGPEAMEAQCPACGAWYDMVPAAETAPSAPPALPVAGPVPVPAEREGA